MQITTVETKTSSTYSGLYIRLIRRILFLLPALLFSGLPLLAYAQNSTSTTHSVREMGEKSFSRFAPFPSWVDLSLEAEETPSAHPLLIRLSDQQIYAGNDTAVYIHKMMQANDASMLPMVGKLEIAFHPEYQHVNLHSLRVIRGANSIDKMSGAEIRFFQREQELDVGVLTGAVTASIVVDDLRVGDTVDLAYTIAGQNPVMDKKVSNVFSWDSNYPTQRRRIILNTPENRNINYRILGPGAEKIQIKIQKTAERRITRFTGDNLTAIDFEPYTPNDVIQFRQIQFSEYKDWHEVALWARELFKIDKSSMEVDQVTASMLVINNDEKSLLNALQYVQSEIRYLSVSIGENSHRPYRPEIVLGRRYGDCKDKALLLVAMLRQLGVNAAPVLISTYSAKGLDRMLPSPGLFDHAIVQVILNGKTYYLDPTRNTQYGGLDKMGQVHAGSDILEITENTVRLTNIPIEVDLSLPTSSVIERAKMSQIEGPAEFAITYQYSGVEAEYVRYFIARQNKDQLSKYYNGLVLSRYPNAELKSTPRISDNKQGNSIKIELDFRVPEFLKRKNGGWQAYYHPQNFRERFYIPQNPKRQTPLVVPTNAAFSHYEFELTLPSDFDAKYPPSKNTLRNSAFDIREDISFEGRIFRVSLDMKILNDRVAAKDVSNYLADIRKLSVFLEGSISIYSENLKASSLIRLNDSPIKQRQAARQKEAVIENTKIIDNASGSSDTAFDARCERGLANGRLGKKTDALNDISDMQKGTTLTKELWRCKADILFSIGDMKNSELAYSSAIGMGDNSGTTCFLRSLSRFSQGRWREAADNFAQAYDRYTEENDKMRAELFRVLALRRMNQRQQIAFSIVAQDEWPNIMIAAVTGSKSEDEILKAVHRKTGDELDAALSEAYYFIAQINLINNNKMKAAVYLQRSIDKGILSNNLQAPARAELERLHR